MIKITDHDINNSDTKIFGDCVKNCDIYQKN